MVVNYAKIFDEFTESHTPGAVLRRVSDIPAQEVRWLWPGRIPLGKLTLFAGDPGLGKSFVTLDIAAHATLGKKWPDGDFDTLNWPRSIL
jgi:predicted ATP-dependent serine protease